MAEPHESPLIPLEWAAIACIVMVWSVNNAAAKYATLYLPPLFMGGVRFAIALAVLAPFLRPPWPDWRKLLPLALLTGPLHFGALYLCFAHGHNLSVLGVVLQAWIPLTALMSWWFLGETLAREAVAGITISFAGVVWMSLDPTAGADLAAIILAVVASVFWAVGTVFARRMPQASALKVQGVTSLVAAPVLLAAAFATEPGIGKAVQTANLLVWGCVLFAALASTLGASGLLLWLLQRRQTGRVTSYFQATPLVTAGLGVWLFGDKLTLRMVCGGLVMLVGVGLVAISERRNRLLVAAASVDPT